LTWKTGFVGQLASIVAVATIVHIGGDISCVHSTCFITSIFCIARSRDITNPAKQIIVTTTTSRIASGSGIARMCDISSVAFLCKQFTSIFCIARMCNISKVSIPG
jgi:hypothetical protein